MAAMFIHLFIIGFSYCDIVRADSLRSTLTTYEIDAASKDLQSSNYPKAILKKAQEKLKSVLSNSNRGQKKITEKEIENAKERVLTLKAYLDEAERDLFSKNWYNLQIYLYTFAEQDDAFAILVEQLFPTDNDLDRTAREGLAFEANLIFQSLDELREASSQQNLKMSEKAYATLLLAYDNFLKAGDLYPTYDFITSTEIFFADTPRENLRFDTKSKVQVLDQVVLTSGPDMGKLATVINIDGPNVVIKLDKDGKAYQEVKYVKYSTLAKAAPSTNNKLKKK